MQDTKQKNKKIILIVIAAIIILLIVWILFLPKKGTEEVSQTVTVTKEVIQDVIQVSGYIQPAQQQNLQSPGEGLIKKVAVKEGDTVKKETLFLPLTIPIRLFKLQSRNLLLKKKNCKAILKILNL